MSDSCTFKSMYINTIPFQKISYIRKNCTICTTFGIFTVADSIIYEIRLGNINTKHRKYMLLSSNCTRIHSFLRSWGICSILKRCADFIRCRNNIRIDIVR